jgi:hypothetical protein
MYLLVVAEKLHALSILSERKRYVLLFIPQIMQHLINCFSNKNCLRIYYGRHKWRCVYVCTWPAYLLESHICKDADRNENGKIHQQLVFIQRLFSSETPVRQSLHGRGFEKCVRVSINEEKGEVSGMPILFSCQAAYQCFAYVRHDLLQQQNDEIEKFR